MCMCVFMCVCIYVCMILCVYMYIYIHTYTHTCFYMHIHTHTHTHTHNQDKHSVAGGGYTKARCAAFMGLAIIQEALLDGRKLACLCDLAPSEFYSAYASTGMLPGKVEGVCACVCVCVYLCICIYNNLCVRVHVSVILCMHPLACCLAR